MANETSADGIVQPGSCRRCSSRISSAKTPAPVVTALAQALHQAIASKQTIDSLAKFGTEPAFLPTADFTAWIKAEILRWGPVVKASGFVATE